MLLQKPADIQRNHTSHLAADLISQSLQRPAKIQRRAATPNSSHTWQVRTFRARDFASVFGVRRARSLRRRSRSPKRGGF